MLTVNNELAQPVARHGVSVMRFKIGLPGCASGVLLRRVAIQVTARARFVRYRPVPLMQPAKLNRQRMVERIRKKPRLVMRGECIQLCGEFVVGLLL